MGSGERAKGRLLAGFALLALLTLLLPLGAQGVASSPHFRIEGGFCVAAGRAASGSFRLAACLGEGPSGLAASDSFRVRAGCAAFLPTGNGWEPRPDPDPRLVGESGASVSVVPGSGPQGKLPDGK